MATRSEVYLRRLREARTLALAIEETLRDLDARIGATEAQSASFEEARTQLIQLGIQRINEVLAPALDLLAQYTSAGFAQAPILAGSSATFATGPTALTIAPTARDVFVPSPFVGLMRESTTGDWALAQLVSYSRATGLLTVNILAVHGAAGPHTDVRVFDTAGSLQAQTVWLTDTQAARDTATGAATTATGAATTATTQAGVATAQAGTATAKAAAAASSEAGAAGSATLASQWASLLSALVAATDYSAKEYAVGATVPAGSAKRWAVSTTVVAGGFKGAYGYAQDAAASASAAAASAASIAGGPVTSVNGKTGIVALVEADIPGLVSDLAAKAAKAANLSDLADPKAARANLKIDALRKVGDVAATLTAADTTVWTNTALTLPRTWTLPAAADLNAGGRIHVYDAAGAVGGVNVVTLAAAGADTINGAATLVLRTTGGSLTLVSDGVSKWAVAIPATSGVSRALALYLRGNP